MERTRFISTRYFSFTGFHVIMFYVVMVLDLTSVPDFDNKTTEKVIGDQKLSPRSHFCSIMINNLKFLVEPSLKSTEWSKHIIIIIIQPWYLELPQEFWKYLKLLEFLWKTSQGFRAKTLEGCHEQKNAAPAFLIWRLPCIILETSLVFNIMKKSAFQLKI